MKDSVYPGDFPTTKWEVRSQEMTSEEVLSFLKGCIDGSGSDWPHQFLFGQDEIGECLIGYFGNGMCSDDHAKAVQVVPEMIAQLRKSLIFIENTKQTLQKISKRSNLTWIDDLAEETRQVINKARGIE